MYIHIYTHIYACFAFLNQDQQAFLPCHCCIAANYCCHSYQHSSLQSAAAAAVAAAALSNCPQFLFAIMQGFIITLTYAADAAAAPTAVSAFVTVLKAAR